MSIRLIILFSCINVISYGQSQEKKDSLVNVICKQIIDNKGEADSIRVSIAYEKHLFPFLDKYAEELRNDIGTSIYFRLQRNCREFKQILEREDPPKGDWKSVAEKPTSKLSGEECRKFLDHQDYTYLEPTGDTVRLRIENGFWTDNFKDGTFSKLKFAWVDDCEFEIEFIESNNRTRSGFSKPGDKYKYQVVERKENYYDMSVEILGTGGYFMFKLYF